MNKILQHHYGEKATSQSVNSLATNTSASQSSIQNTANPIYQNKGEQSLDNTQEDDERERWIEQYNSPRESIYMTSERFPKSYKISKDALFPLGAIIQPYYSNFVIVLFVIIVY